MLAIAMRRRQTTLLLSMPLVVLAILGTIVASASAVEPAPGWELMGSTTPAIINPGHEATIDLNVFDLGAQNASAGAIVTDVLPSDVVPTGKSKIIVGAGFSGGGASDECEVAGQIVTCELPEVEISKETVTIHIDVTALANAQGSELDHASIAGGGALETAGTTFPVTFGATEPSFGFASLHAWLTNADGTTDTQAGSHPYDLTVAYALNKVAREENTDPHSHSFEEVLPAGGEPRNVNINLPPGIVGNPEAVPQCTRAEFDAGLTASCPVDSQIGVNRAFGGIAAPVYNMVPPPGVAAQFGFKYSETEVFLDSGVRTGGDNGISTHIDNLPQNNVYLNSTTIWGIPAEASHDVSREGITATGEECESDCPAGVPPAPLLTLGTACQEPEEFTGELIGTWEDESLVAPRASSLMSDSEGNPVELTGCERLQPFNPSITIAPDTTYTDTPAGLSVEVKMPQGLNPEGLATPGLQNTTVVLPEGLNINPGQATGLVACQPSQEALGSLPDGEVNEGPPSCPAASKIGTVELSTPVLRDKLVGDVYILDQNPPDLQFLIAASGDGVNLKLVGSVHLNEATGQSTTTLENTPDIPFTDFKLSFSGGPQAALATPTACGTYESTADFTPWSTPFIEDALDSSRFQITNGPNGSACTSPMPFTPTMAAGSTTDQAGGYTGFSMLLQRGDEQQRIKTLSFTTPEGLLGMISKVPLCPEPQAAQGTCSSASQIGHTIIGAGPGPYPLFIPQAGQPPAPIYLTGGYDGAPYGLSIVVPIVAGPFTLETQVVRARIAVDPHTAQLTITTDPLPTIVDGIPADLRSINAVIDRPGFIFNPTNCNPRSFSGTATSIEGASAPISSPFQVGACQALAFNPEFKAAASGTTSKADGASLDAKIVYPTTPPGDNQASSQSNIASVKVDLPKQLPSRLTTLQKACLAAVFEANPANCPGASVVGHATTTTPVLPVPLSGPAYFVSHGDEAFPSLIVVLQGYGVTVDLVGTTFISKAGITSSTFKEVPDVPISLFDLALPEGQYSALAANGNLCIGKLVMPTVFTAQNGAVLKQSTPISVTGCTNDISVSSHSVKGRALTISVSVPAAGKLTATGTGLSKASKSANGRETVSLSLTQKKAGRLKAKVRLTFTPSKGKKEFKSVTVEFKK
jgi:hypothetical protein